MASTPRRHTPNSVGYGSLWLATSRGKQMTSTSGTATPASPSASSSPVATGTVVSISPTESIQPITAAQLVWGGVFLSIAVGVAVLTLGVSLFAFGASAWKRGGGRQAGSFSFNRHIQQAVALTIGVAMVAGLAVLSNNVWVYIFAVLFAGALMVSPAFSQNLAAILFNRQWGLVPATPAERDAVSEQHAAESTQDLAQAQALTSAQPPQGGRTFAPLLAAPVSPNAATEFERSVLDALKSEPGTQIGLTRVQEEAAIQAFGYRYIPDAVAKWNGAPTVVEVRYFASEARWPAIFAELRRMMDGLAAGERLNRVKGLVIVPAVLAPMMKLPASAPVDIEVYTFDPANNELKPHLL